MPKLTWTPWHNVGEWRPERRVVEGDLRLCASNCG